jgi:hypothetical protein
VYFSEIEAISPVSPVSSKLSTHVSYLDTAGRPALIFEYKQLTDKHVGSIYVGGLFSFRLWMLTHFLLFAGIVQAAYFGPSEETYGSGDSIFRFFPAGHRCTTS